MELIVNTFGTNILKEGNSLIVVHKDGRQAIPIDSIKTISISKGAAISSDAAIFAVENNVEVLFIDNQGMPQARLWSGKFGSISTIRKHQLEFSFSSKAVDWIKQVLAQKFDNQIALLLTIQPTENNEVLKKFTSSINKINDYKNKVLHIHGEIVSDIAPNLRGWEGIASKYYFDCISNILPTEYQFKERSQHPATDIFNCLLNYGYGVLYGKIEGALIKAGIDPYIGIMHRDDYNRPVLVYDIIELYRIWIDFIVIHLCRQKAISEDAFSIKDDGSFWLEALGKRILIQSINDYFDEIILLNGLSRSRATHIMLYAQNLAQQFLQFKND